MISMYGIGVDIGTTTICAIVVEGKTGRITASVTENNDSFIESENTWEKIQDSAVIYRKAEKLVRELSQQYAPIGCIGITGQMHGIIYIDGAGNAASPLYTWQDGRGDLDFRDNMSCAEYLSQKTQYKLATGYGAVTHFYNLCNGLVPPTAVSFCTIHDYVAMKFARRTVPLVNATNAASLGVFDTPMNNFDKRAIHEAGMDAALFPDVSKGMEILGTTENNIPVAVAIGDNQASFIGSVQKAEESILVNVGTGSQISLYTEGNITCPHIETRPLGGQGFLLVGAPLCGGRAYALLETFFRNIVSMATGKESDPLYNIMNEAGEAHIPEKDKLQISTKFSGTRENPAQRGSIGNIGIENFTPRHLVAGVLEGIAQELYELYKNMEPKPGKKPTILVGSGNGIRKNTLLQRILAEKFGIPLRIPVYKEEAAYGVALFAMVGIGHFKDLPEAQEIIQYQNHE